jgi:hypothetical protein
MPLIDILVTKNTEKRTKKAFFMIFTKSILTGATETPEILYGEMDNTSIIIVRKTGVRKTHKLEMSRNFVSILIVCIEKSDPIDVKYLLLRIVRLLNQ